MFDHRVRYMLVEFASLQLEIHIRTYFDTSPEMSFESGSLQMIQMDHIWRNIFGCDLCFRVFLNDLDQFWLNGPVRYQK